MNTLRRQVSAHSGERRTHGSPRRPVAEEPPAVVGAASSYLASLLPGGGPASVRTVEVLLSLRPEALGVLDRSTRRLVSAALIVALARHGSPEDAAAVAELEADHRLRHRAGEVSPALLVQFWSAVSEAHLTTGVVGSGASAARRACEYAEDASVDTLRYRALSLLAACLAANGEFTQAAGVISRAVTLETRNRWTSGEAAYPLRLAQVLLASSRLDAAALGQLADDLRGVPAAPPSIVALTALADAVVALTRGRPEDGIAALTTAANSVDARALAPLMHNFLTTYLATLLVSRGEPQRALALLSGRTSDAHHTVCIDLQRASAHLQLGDDRAVLATTTSCIRIASEHNLRTLASVLLRRAIAYERLELPSLADAAFIDAFQLIRRSGAMTPLLTLPSGPLDTLLTRLRRARPDLGKDVQAIRAQVRTMPAAEPPAVVPPPVTAREAVIARQLRSDRTLSEIAESLHVSRNTVKSQVASLYRKLGVASRDDAIAELERTGYFDYRD